MGYGLPVGKMSEGERMSERRKSILFFTRVCFYCTGSLAFLVNIGIEVSA